MSDAVPRPWRRVPPSEAHPLTGSAGNKRETAHESGEDSAEFHGQTELDRVGLAASLPTISISRFSVDAGGGLTA